jgi:hypothetical protein
VSDEKKIFEYSKRVTLLRSYERLMEKEKDFFPLFAEEMKSRDKRINKILSSISKDRQSDVAKHSLEQVVLFTECKDANESLKSLAHWHGEGAMKLSEDMFMKWKDAFLHVFKDFDPYASDSLTNHWNDAMLRVIYFFVQHGKKK